MPVGGSNCIQHTEENMLDPQTYAEFNKPMYEEENGNQESCSKPGTLRPEPRSQDAVTGADDEIFTPISNDQPARPLCSTSLRSCVSSLNKCNMILSVVNIFMLLGMIIGFSYCFARIATLESVVIEAQILSQGSTLNDTKGIGETGSPGVKGDQGRPEYGVKGEKGEQGLNQKGQKGQEGEKGQKGSDGTSALISGGVYTIWGKTSCPASSTLIYEGIVGNTDHATTGGGVDFLCMPFDPQWLKYNLTSNRYTYVMATHYATGDWGIFADNIHYKRVVCAQCYTETRPAIIIVPARTSCPSGWIREYYGYLMANQHNLLHPTSNICVSTMPEYKPQVSPGYGSGLAFLIADCNDAGGTSGSLDECGPGQYVTNRQITCVVCSR